MPFDPFFGSANKKHYVANADVETLISKVNAMSPLERDRWYRETWAKKDRTLVERHVLNRLQFLTEVRRRGYSRLEAETFADRLAQASNKKGCVVYSGLGGTGGHMGHQNRSFKSQHYSRKVPKAQEAIRNRDVMDGMRGGRGRKI